MNEQEQSFVARLRSLGGSAGNGKLHEALGWPEATYNEVRQGLIDASHVKSGRGRGGSVAVVSASTFTTNNTSVANIPRVAKKQTIGANTPSTPTAPRRRGGVVKKSDLYASLWASRDALRGGMDASQYKDHVLALLFIPDAAQRRSMMLSPESTNEPYKPIMIIEDKRTTLPDDLHESDVAVLAQIVDFIDDIRLRARVADLVWLLGNPRDVKFALAAIDAYRSIPLNEETWVRDGREYWSRAFGLARTLGKASGDRLHQMETSILTAFEGASNENGFLALWLAELLESNGLGRDRRVSGAEKLDRMARELGAGGDFHRAGEYWRVSGRWFAAVEDHAKAAETTVALAESWAKQADASVASDNPSYMLAANFYENAIKFYRTIPRVHRATWGVDDRLVELQSLLNEAGEKSLAEMGVVRSPEIDITKPDFEACIQCLLEGGSGAQRATR